MKRSSRELKRIARDLLNNRYTIPMGAFVTASFITAVIGIPFSLSPARLPSVFQIVTSLLAKYLIFLIGLMLTTGINLIHMNMTREKEWKLVHVFEPFLHSADRSFFTAFLFSLFVLAASLPAICGGVFFYFCEDLTASLCALIAGGILTAVLLISAVLNYSFVFFLIIDKPQIKVRNLFQESRLMMKGNRRRLLFLLLSLLPWLVPFLCSFGIAALWLSPYITQIWLNFYLDCTGELNRLPVRNYAKSSSFSDSDF